MSSLSADKGLALLQLSKWDPSPVIDFEKFHDAFLSPSRELILLLAEHGEGLVVPLVAGNFFVSFNLSV